MNRSHSIIALTFFWLLLAVQILAGPKDPIEGREFDKFVESQNDELQEALRAIFTEETGYIVTGSLDPNVSDTTILVSYGSVRVICPNLESLNRSLMVLKSRKELKVRNSLTFTETSDSTAFPGYRGIMAEVHFGETDFGLQLQTINQLRFLIWMHSLYSISDSTVDTAAWNEYAVAVSEYLHEIDKGNLSATEPKAVDNKLPVSFDIYAPAPPYVIEGYQNYKDYLFSHAAVTTDFAVNVLGFVPTVETLGALKNHAAYIAFPNKEAPLLQDELRKFIQRGGQLSSMHTLTKEIFDTLQPGEYFFGVGLNGNIRFGRELTREEVAKIEETGKKPARANHAFLFLGEPLLTAGAFFVGCETGARLSRVNTQSGHYFYSNITSTIKVDIAERSDSYFLSIGHFFSTLDNLGIVYSDVVVTKL